MNTATIETSIFIFGALVNVLSLLAVFVTFIAISRRLRGVGAAGGNTLLLDVVRWMTLCNTPPCIINGTTDVFSALGKQVPWSKNHTFVCTGLGFTSQFSSVASFLWSSVLAWILLMLLRERSSLHIRRQMAILHIAVWTLTLAAAAIPLIGRGSNKYEFLGKNNQCWIKDGISRLLFYGPCLFTVALSLAVLCFAAHKHRGLFEKPRALQAITHYVVIFVITWSIPATRRLIELGGRTKPPEWMSYVTVVVLGTYGILNFFVWRTLIFPSRRMLQESSTLAGLAARSRLRAERVKEKERIRQKSMAASQKRLWPPILNTAGSGSGSLAPYQALPGGGGEQGPSRRLHPNFHHQQQPSQQPQQQHIKWKSSSLSSEREDERVNNNNNNNNKGGGGGGGEGGRRRSKTNTYSALLEILDTDDERSVNNNNHRDKDRGDRSGRYRRRQRSMESEEEEEEGVVGEVEEEEEEEESVRSEVVYARGGEGYGEDVDDDSRRGSRRPSLSSKDGRGGGGGEESRFDRKQPSIREREAKGERENEGREKDDERGEERTTTTTTTRQEEKEYGVEQREGEREGKDDHHIRYEARYYSTRERGERERNGDDDDGDGDGRENNNNHNNHRFERRRTSENRFDRPRHDNKKK